MPLMMTIWMMLRISNLHRTIYEFHCPKPEEKNRERERERERE
jgi:hypothetical protein